MALERRTLGRLPSAATGSGDPVLVIAGLMPYTGPGGDRMAHVAIGSLEALADRRRLVLVNRRAGLPRGMTMAEMAAEHADAIRELGGAGRRRRARRRAAASPSSSRPTTPTSSAASCSSAPRAGSGPRAGSCSAGSRRGSARARTARRSPSWPPTSCRRARPARRGRRRVGRRAAGPPRPAGPRRHGDDDRGGGRLRPRGLRDPIAAPTLLVAGRDDRFYAPELFEETARLIPGSDLRRARRQGAHRRAQRRARRDAAILAV